MNYSLAEKPTPKEKPKKPTVIKKMTGESTAKDIAKEFKKEGFHVTVDSPRSLKVTSPIYGVTAFYKKYSNSYGDSKWEMMEFNRKKPVYLNREDVHNNEYNEWMDKLNDVHKKMFPTEPE